jgi:hypothetical protein
MLTSLGGRGIIDFMQKLFLSSVLTLAASCLLAVFLGPVRTIAQSPASLVWPIAAQDMPFTLEGKITDLAPGKITVNTEENILFHIIYNDETKFKKPDGSEGSSKDLQKGLTVHIAGDLTESGEIKAATVEIRQASSPINKPTSLP